MDFCLFCCWNIFFLHSRRKLLKKQTKASLRPFLWDGCCASDAPGALWLPRPASSVSGLDHGGVPPATAGPQGPGQGQEPLPPSSRGSVQDPAGHLRWDRGGGGGRFVPAGGGEGPPLLLAVLGEPPAEHTDPPPQLHSHTDKPGLQWLRLYPVRGPRVRTPLLVFLFLFLCYALTPLQTENWTELVEPAARLSVEAAETCI